MRVTLSIDDDVLEAARAIAAAEHRSLGDVISALARRSLAPVEITQRDGFPVFDVQAGEPAFTTADVTRALDDE